MIRKLCEKLEPPGPKELGWSDSNALEMKSFSPYTKNKTWEDWEEYVKKHYPIRYQFKQLFSWFGQKKFNLEMHWYKFTSRYFKKQHLLDCRQGYNGYDLYEYGYCDPVEKMLYANFNILKRFVEKEEPLTPEAYDAILEDGGGQDEHFAIWRAASVEIYDLYDYWMVRRAKQDKAISFMHERLKSIKDEKTNKALRKEWLKAKDDFDKEEQNNLERLIKVREYMWT